MNAVAAIAENLAHAVNACRAEDYEYASVCLNLAVRLANRIEDYQVIRRFDHLVCALIDSTLHLEQGNPIPYYVRENTGKCWFAPELTFTSYQVVWADGEVEADTHHTAHSAHWAAEDRMSGKVKTRHIEPMYFR